VKYSKSLLVKPGDKKFSLVGRRPDDTCGVDDRAAAERETEKYLKRMKDLQYTLYAEGKQSLLVVLQAMDAGGKDGTIRKVLGPLNPQGVNVTSFKSPTAEELSHDFLWRVHKVVPAKGMIGVFNRSHYEDVLIVRVRDFAPKSVWSKRYDQINEFEATLAAAGTTIVKIFLHVSKEEQFERLVERLEDPTKHWKVNPGDFEERQLWDDYMEAFEEVFRRCSTTTAPWYVVPADKKWFRNLAIAQILTETLEGMKCRMPEPAHDIEAIKATYVAAPAAGTARKSKKK